MKRALITAVLLALSTPLQAEVVNLVANGSFENPIIRDFQYQPSSTDWYYSSLSGVSDGSNPGYGGFCTTGAIPDGNQFGFIQEQGTFILQPVTFPASGTYTLSYFVGGRLGSLAPWPYGPYGGDTTYDVRLDSTVLVTATTATDSPMARYETTFNTSAGTHMLQFLITSAPPLPTGLPDQTALFDAISITAVPEPSTLALFGIGTFALLAYGWRRIRRSRYCARKRSSRRGEPRSQRSTSNWTKSVPR